MKNSHNSFLEKVIHHNIKEYLDAKHSESPHTEERNTEINYFKLSYVGEHSNNIKKWLYKIYKNLCKLDNGIKIILYTSKIRDYFSTKDLIPKCFQSSVVYQYSCTRCGSCYVGRTDKHLNTWIEEHLGSKSSSIFKHLRENPKCQYYDQKSQFKFWIMLALSMSSP